MKAFFVVCVIFLLLTLLMMTGDHVGHADILKRDGVVHIQNSFPPEIRNRTLASVYQELGNCKGRKMGEINNASNKRIDVSLHLTDSIRQIIRHIWTEHRDVWTSHLGCSNPRLLECSALVTFPGSGNQTWHRDISYDPTKSRLLSIGVALQDVTASMGPLEAVKQTHMNNEDITEEMEDTLGKKMVCLKDDIVAWDSSVHHRGTANTSDTPRAMLTITLGSEGELPEGPTYSLLPRYKNIRIQDV